MTIMHLMLTSSPGDNDYVDTDYVDNDYVDNDYSKYTLAEQFTETLHTMCSSVGMRHRRRINTESKANCRRCFFWGKGLSTASIENVIIRVD